MGISPVTDCLVKKTVTDLCRNNRQGSFKQVFNRELLTRFIIIIGTPFTRFCDAAREFAVGTGKLFLYPLRLLKWEKLSSKEFSLNHIFNHYVHAGENAVMIPVSVVRGMIKPSTQSLGKKGNKESKVPELTDSIASRLDPKATKLLYKAFEDLHNLFEKEGIWYSLTSGSYLGAVRHKGIIPWDDDGDIFVKEEHMKKLLGLKDELSKLGYDLYECPEGWPKIVPKAAKRADGTYFPEIDVFPMKQSGDRFVHGSANALRYWPKEYFTKDEVANMKLWDFGKLKLWAPAEHSRFCSEMYGSNWNEVGYRIWDHDKGCLHEDKRKFKIVDRSCA